MSIPVSIDPLGTLGGAELPYVQPVLTSATTWSNNPTFPVEVLFASGTAYDPLWTFFGKVKGTSMSSGFRGTTGKLITHFAKPVSIRAFKPEYVRVGQVGNYRAPIVKIEVLTGDGYVNVFDSQSHVVQDETYIVPTKLFSTDWRWSMTAESFPNMSQVQLEAYYKQ